ncbi:hypothetical protein KKH05_00225, partial [Patescibacteria group bacterium]|nr:hypothetical protein [Patescibacteria group bacterium]
LTAIALKPSQILREAMMDRFVHTPGIVMMSGEFAAAIAVKPATSIARPMKPALLLMTAIAPVSSHPPVLVSVRVENVFRPSLMNGPKVFGPLATLLVEPVARNLVRLRAKTTTETPWLTAIALKPSQILREAIMDRFVFAIQKILIYAIRTTVVLRAGIGIMGYATLIPNLPAKLSRRQQSPLQQTELRLIR